MRKGCLMQTKSPNCFLKLRLVFTIYSSGNLLMICLYDILYPYWIQRSNLLARNSLRACHMPFFDRKIDTSERLY